MKKARVIFHKCLQDSQELGSDEKHMVSRVFFTIEIDGEKFKGFYADLEQMVDSDYKTGLIEVGAPQDYEGAFNHEDFRDLVEKYYGSCVSSEAARIRIGKGAHGICMYNNVLKKRWYISLSESEAQLKVVKLQYYWE